MCVAMAHVHVHVHVISCCRLLARCCCVHAGRNWRSEYLRSRTIAAGPSAHTNGESLLVASARSHRREWLEMPKRRRYVDEDEDYLLADTILMRRRNSQWPAVQGAQRPRHAK